MPEADNSKAAKNFHVDVPATSEPFFVKGSNNLDWGMKNRLASIFRPDTGRAVAFKARRLRLDRRDDARHRIDHA